jgi:hypothetical protein
MYSHDPDRSLTTTDKSCDAPKTIKPKLPLSSTVFTLACRLGLPLIDRPLAALYRLDRIQRLFVVQ